MKQLNQFITEYIIKKKLDKPIDSEDHYDYFPETKQELIKNIEECLNSNNYNLNCIDTSKITDMSYLFKNITLPNNEQIYFDKWNVGNVKDMSYMFANCYYINPDLSSWNVSNVEYMTRMFENCSAFEGKGLENWNVSKVIDIKRMFFGCSLFNCNLGNWDVSSITDMSFTFYDCKIFEGKGLENWEVINVENMICTFFNCLNFNCNLSKWDVSSVVNANGMFDECENFDCDLSNWNVSKIIDTSTMFYECLNFTGKGLDKWKLSSIRNMNYMFCGCEKLDCDLSKWNIDKNVSMKKALKDCNLKNKPSWYKE